MLGDGKSEHRKNKVRGFVLGNDKWCAGRTKWEVLCSEATIWSTESTKQTLLCSGTVNRSTGKNKVRGFVLGRKIASYFFYLCGMKTLLKILTIFIAIGAIGGSVMMWADPSGAGWGGEPLLQMLRDKMPWPDILFRNFIPSGYALLAVNGLPQILAAVMLFKKHRLACRVSLACGILLMLWIILEWWVWGFNAMSNIFFILGLAEAVLAVISIRKG